MAEYPRTNAGRPVQGTPHSHRPSDNGCPPSVPPAEQPKSPSGECQPVEPKTPPDLPEPEKCADPPCCCPAVPPDASTCLDDLIKEQAREITAAERAKTFKAELEALLQKAKAAKEEYTVEKYKQLRSEWKKRDAEIVEVIRKLVCAVPCWWCVIECHICPLVYAIRYRQQKLWGDDRLAAEIHSLYDLRYWHERNRDARKREFDRIKLVLAAWENPAQTIQAVLDDTHTILQEANFIGPDASELIYTVFFRVVPLHLSIAPPADSGCVTGIAKEYTDFCHCDEGHPDDCCGPDVGKPSVRALLIGPKPYLVHPDQFFTIICCLAKERYLPAKDALARAEADYQSVDDEIKRYTTEIDEKLSSFEKDAKAAIPRQPIDCDAYQPADGDECHEPGSRPTSA